MKLQMNAVHFDADPSLTNFIQEKLNKLDTFFDNILSGEVYLRLEKDTPDRHLKVVEVKLFVPGGSFFVKEQNSTFESATDKALEAMKQQLKKHKEKVKAHS